MRKTAVIVGLLAIGAWTTARAEVLLYQADLSGATEVPAVATAARGSANINVDTVTKQLTWRIDYNGLSGPAAAAHIHCGANPGANAGVAVSLGTAPNLGSPMQGSGAMTDAQFADLRNLKCYVNIHTEANKGGEIRGQISR